MAKKMTGESEERQDEILHQLDESKPQGHVAVSGGVLTDSACDDYGKQFFPHVSCISAYRILCNYDFQQEH
jgi:hypothetical protein